MKILTVDQIKGILPQRFPFLFIDGVNELKPGKRVVAYKNVTGNDGFFQGHFPGNPVMPGTLIIEAMAQASAFLYYSKYKYDLAHTPTYYIGSIKAEFKKPVIPGDQLVIKAETAKLIVTGGFVNAEALVDNICIAKAELIFAVKK